MYLRALEVSVLKQGSLFQLRSNRIQRTDGLVVICMCHYPRGLARSARHEYSSKLAPDRKLLKDFKEAEKKVGHNEAFAESKYEERFTLTTEAYAELERYSELSKERNVYLLCQCEIKDKCHREILLLVAQKLYGAEIDKVFHAYPTAVNRLTSTL